MSYAVIQIGKPPQEMIDLFASLAVRLAERGWTVRSGLNGGMEIESARAAAKTKGNCELYRPWTNFGPEKIEGAIEMTMPGRRAHEIAGKHYPAWRQIGRAAQKQHARYVKVLLGDMEKDPNTRVCDVIVGWSERRCAPRDNVYGSDQTVRVGQTLGIPWVDLYGHTRAGEALIEVMRSVHESRGIPFGRKTKGTRT